ncbi:hypothetical protein P8C59_009614 [Phyllachora maydis]|uniref:Uncharacterized protein n=1 Tax=Phyllachora maydis TaxID=1825666 RepID=A0AAD9IFW5_9PEZI|nr:hypothetical protein P8C59_009614 [Phyllachora maydis]
MADQAKEKEDKEDSEDYSEVIEVLKHLKASVEDSVSAIKNISSTLAPLTNCSNAATTGKTSYSPRFNPFSGTIDLDSPPRPLRKEPYLGPAINSATSNLDPPIDIGSKEGFKDTITSSIVKELSKKAYTIPDNRISNFLENPDISNTYSDSDQAVLLILLYNSLSSSPRAAISWIYIPSKAFKLLARMLGLIASSLNIEYLMADILEESRNPATEAYRAAYIANSSNSISNSNSNPSKKGKNKKKGKKKASYNVKGQNYSAKSAEQASFILGSYNLAIEKEKEESNSSSNSRYKKRKDFKGKGLKTSSNIKAKYKDNQPRRRPRDPALYNSWLYNTGSTDHISNSKERPASIGSITLEVLSRKAPPTYTKLVLDNVLYLPNIDINIVSGVGHYNSGGCLIKETLYRGNRRYIAVLDFKKSGFVLDVKGSSKPILHANFAFPLDLTSYNTTKSIELQCNKIVVEIPSNSIRKEDYRPIIEDTIVSEAIEPKKRYKLRNSPAKGTTLEGIGPSLGGKRPCRPFIEDNTVLSQPTDNTALEGELVDLDLDLEGAVSPDPSNLNTKKPISIEIGPSKLEPYEFSSDSELDKPLPDKPINPVIVQSTRPTISIRKPELLEAFPQTIEPIFAPKPIEVISPNQPITNESLDNSDLILKGDKMQLDYYKLLAKTSSYILSFVYKARKRVISKYNDYLFIGPNIGYITDLKKRLNKVYIIEDLGPAAYFLGVQIIRDRPNRRLWLNQLQYIEEAVSRFN